MMRQNKLRSHKNKIYIRIHKIDMDQEMENMSKCNKGGYFIIGIFADHMLAISTTLRFPETSSS